MLDVLSLVGSVLLLGLILRVLSLLLVAGIRLSDIIGYVVATASLLTLVVYDWERFGSAAVFAWVGGVVLGVVWAAHTVRTRKNDPDHELLGLFLVGRPPHAVTNWVAIPSRKA